jgi:hypothetical protein
MSHLAASVTPKRDVSNYSQLDQDDERKEEEPMETPTDLGEI